MANVYGSTPPATLTGTTTGPRGILTNFSVAANSDLTGIRYYSVSSPSTDVLTYTVYGAGVNNQTQLATGTFTPSGTVGWQTITFGTPVPLTAGLVYTLNVGLETGNIKYGYTLSALPVTANGITISHSAVRTGAAGVWAENNATALTDLDAYGFDFEVSASTALDISVGADRSSTTAQSTTVTGIATGGSGTKSYAWTVTSGPSTSTAQFASATSASTTFLPSGGVGTYVLRCTVTDTSGSDFDELTLTVTAPPTTARLVDTSPSAGWTVFGGTLPTVLSDSDTATGVRSGASPTALVYDGNLGTLAVPGPTDDLTLTVGIWRNNGTTGTAVARLYEGATLRSTSTTRTLPTTAAGSLTVVFPAADLAAITPSAWTTGLRLTITVTAS
jgi:hypothetical protein